MVNYADRCFDIFTDIDSPELPDVAYWLQVRLIDRENPEHGQAVWVLRRLLEWVSADPRTEMNHYEVHIPGVGDGHFYMNEDEADKWRNDGCSVRMNSPSDDDEQWRVDMAVMRDEADYSRYGW